MAGMKELSSLVEGLEAYKVKGRFTFKQDDILSKVCNVPKGDNCSGIYLIYAQEDGHINLIYIGISGRRGPDGKIRHRKDGLRGRFLTGKTEGVLRKQYWPQKMVEENIEALQIHWYVTHDNKTLDFPRDLEIALLTKYLSIFGKLPRWNREI